MSWLLSQFSSSLFSSSLLFSFFLLLSFLLVSLLLLSLFLLFLSLLSSSCYHCLCCHCLSVAVVLFVVVNFVVIVFVSKVTFCVQMLKLQHSSDPLTNYRYWAAMAAKSRMFLNMCTMGRLSVWTWLRQAGPFLRSREI